MAVGEWDQRQLCADGACIGVIGPDGTCKVCGRAAPNWGDERNRGLLPLPDDDDDDDAGAARHDDGGDDEGLDAGGADDHDDEYEDAEDDDDEGGDADDLDGEDAGDAPRPAGAGEWSDRRLCSDGSCIGVIGGDGRCQVCRRPATGAAPEAAVAGATASAADGATEPAAAAPPAPDEGAS